MRSDERSRQQRGAQQSKARENTGASKGNNKNRKKHAA
jgi:hypothetical protein